jgi:hypothetical protein
MQKYLGSPDITRSQYIGIPAPKKNCDGENPQ